MCLYGEFVCIVYVPNPTAKVAQDILAYGQHKLQIAGYRPGTKYQTKYKTQTENKRHNV